MLSRLLPRTTRLKRLPSSNLSSLTSLSPYQYSKQQQIKKQFSTNNFPSPPLNSTPQQLLAFFSQRAPRSVSLEDLTKYGSPPLNELELLESAENTRNELLCGLARRVCPLFPFSSLLHLLTLY